MGALDPKFTELFTVPADNYGEFMRQLRKEVIKYCSDHRPGIDQPVLPPEQEAPKLWFHVDLRGNSSSIKLAIRMDNLYLVGFQTQAGVWWEFDNEQKTHLIDGAEWLGFGGSYKELIGQRGLDTVTLGRAEMLTSVYILAKYRRPKPSLEEVAAVAAATGVELPLLPGADPHDLPKGRLVRLVIMICEGLRFFTVQGTVEREFDAMPMLTAIQGKQVNEWSKISKAVFVWAHNPEARFPELEAVGIYNRNDAARIVALVKDQSGQK
ncbi:hypothetical protein ACP4OV_014556 [Aristida adscensionis]